jgi:uncharacterized Zn finger protein (UPF0148 family)
MKNNDLVVIERDVFCPYCNQNSAVLISETIKSKKTFGCAAIGCKDGCLLYVTGGCWAIVSGFPLFDTKEEHTVNLYGFCPCCGNTYPVIKPEKATIIDKVQNTQERFTHIAGQAKNFAGQAKNFLNKNNQNNYDQLNYDQNNYDPNNNNNNQY